MNAIDILSQVEIKDGFVVLKSSGTRYMPKDFISTMAVRFKLTKKDIALLNNELSGELRPQTENSIWIEKLINKYDIKYSNGVYFIRGTVYTLSDIYKLFWKEEKILPEVTDQIIENIEKISEEVELQEQIFIKIMDKAREGKSLYLESLYKHYPNIEWRALLYNILVPNTKPLFHIFYDDGVGGTGKSTLLEVLIKIVGEEFTSNVLLDQFGNRFIFANMLGKYLNIGDDNGKNDELQNVGTLKSIITGNRVTIDRKNISPIEVRIFAKQLFATNILPYIDFTDGGIMRRLNIIPMNKVFTEHDIMPDLNQEEISHIIWQAVSWHDIETNHNDLAITSSPLFRFYKKADNYNNKMPYYGYQTFCSTYGFRCMNIINFEVKSKFVKSYIKNHNILLEVE